MTLCFFHAIPVAGPQQLTAGIATHLVSKYPAKRQEQDAAQPHGMASRRTRCTEAKASLSSGTGLEVTKRCHRCWQPAGCASRVGGPSHALPQAFQAGLAEQSTELQGTVLSSIPLFRGVTGTARPLFGPYIERVFFLLPVTLLAVCLQGCNPRSAASYPRVRAQKQ